MRRTAPRLAGNICLLMAALSLTVPVAAGTASAASATSEPARTARAAAVPLPQFRSFRLPISGTFTGPSEKITLTGTLDVTVVTIPNAAGGGTAQIISSLDDASGTGATSHRTYDLVGAHRDDQPFSAAATTTLTARPPFLLISPVVPPNPVRSILVSVTVGSTGVIGAVTATVSSPAP
ncbi:hypothetical protein [Streptomyces sp. NPDC002172]